MSGLAELVEELALGRIDENDHGRTFTPALLTQLRAAVFGDVGGTKQGASSGAPIPLNVGAFQLWEDLTGQIAAQFNGATDMRPSPSPAVNLLGWWAAFSAAAYRTDRIPSSDELPLLAREVASERLEGWAKRIRDHFVAPIVKELVFECPACGARRVTVGEGETAVERFALEVTIPKTEDLFVTCLKCHTQWVGNVEVINLGRRSGLPIDVDAIRVSGQPDAPQPDYLREIQDYDPVKHPEHLELHAQREAKRAAAAAAELATDTARSGR